MSREYSVTYKVAPAKSEYVYQDARGPHDRGDTSQSAAGHMWYVLSDGREQRSFGFQSSLGKPIGKGKVSVYDDVAYMRTVHEVTIGLNEAQYAKLSEFSQDPVRHGFDASSYNFLTNSCVDFVYASLHAIGYNERAIEGALLPQKNIRILNDLLLGHGANIIRDDLTRNKDYYNAEDAKMCLWLGAAYPLMPSGETSSAGMEAVRPDSLINININPSPQTHQGVSDENKSRQDVSNGFVVNSSTHSLAFTDASLNKTDFVSTQMASLASGGVRPGEVQLDPNVRPNTYLSQFYIDPQSHADFSLQNAVTVNGLSAMTTLNTYVDPILLDLTGDGVGMTGLQDAVLFDVDNSGTLKRTGWAGPATGILVVDDGSGQIKSTGQMFSEYYAGKAGIDGAPGELRFADGFAALGSEDTNGSGLIDATDPIWSALRVWVDSSHDAVSDTGELKTLAQLGITQINLNGVTTSGEVQDGNRVLARGTFVINGITREALAVDFMGDPVSNKLTTESDGTRVTSTFDGTTITAFAGNNQEGQTLDAGLLGVDNVYGALGDDHLIAAPKGSWLIGGGGSNVYEGSSGDDVFVISAGDLSHNIRGNGGRDTAIIVGEAGLTLNLEKAGLTMAQGGSGHDVIVSGGATNAFMKGGSGGSTLIGGAGNDVLVGGTGRNTIIGGGGKAVIYAGPLGDRIHASDGGSLIYAGGGDDQIHGGDGDDVVEVGHGNATFDGGGGINLVSLHGSYSDYDIARIADGYRISDKVDGRDGSVIAKNIQKLNFSDISAVSLETPSAMPVADFVSVDQTGEAVTGTGPQVFSAAQLLSNDQRLNSHGNLRISQVSNAVGGSVGLTPDGSVSFTPAAGFTGLRSFIYSVEDEAGNPAMSVVDLATGNKAPMRAQVTLKTSDMPSDPLLAQQWYLNDINVLPVWSDYTGKGVRIGQFEPGGDYATEPEIFDIQHPDLVNSVDSAWLLTERANGGPPKIASAHATMVAGVMVAQRNGLGGVGIAYDATLGGHYLANRGEDLTSFGKMVGYDIANNSWGFKTDFALSNFQEGSINIASTLVSSARYAAHNGRGGLGTVIVAAGGNGRANGGSAQGSFTNNNRFSIEVGAINASGDLSTLKTASEPFSSPGASLLVSAPGSQMTSTSHKLETDRGSAFSNDYGTTQGTSFATPIVSGVVALMLQANPNLGYRDVQRILALSARKIDDPSTGWSENGASNWNGAGMHSSEDYGFGSVDARAAVRLAESWSGRSTGENEAVSAAKSAPLGMTLGANETQRVTLALREGIDVEHIEVDIDAEVGRLGDLTVKLISPSGTQSILLDRAGTAKVDAGEANASDAGNAYSGNFKYTFMSTHHWGERAVGDWTLEVTDTSGGLPVTLNNWAVRAYGQTPSADDTFFYTDEYSAIVAKQPDRAQLNNRLNGRKGGRNTINTAALSGDVAIDLADGKASLGGHALILSTPGDIHNLVSGDGNDTLVAGGAKALLDGGRGNNALVGGAGRDVFVVHRRDQGRDTIANFNALDGEKIHLVGFPAKTFSDLRISQQGSDVRIDMEHDQSIVITRQAPDTLTQSHFLFQETFVAPTGYLLDEQLPSMPVEGLGTVILKGGGNGVSYSTDEQGQLVPSLSGMIYSHDLATSDVFVIAAQEGVADYRNTLRGFKHGIDKIDLTQTGVMQLSELSISKSNQATINGLSQIHGVTLEASAPDGRAIKLLYIDAIDVSQLDERDFIFADSRVASSGALKAATEVGTFHALVDRQAILGEPITIPARLENRFKPVGDLTAPTTISNRLAQVEAQFEARRESMLAEHTALMNRSRAEVGSRLAGLLERVNFPAPKHDLERLVSAPRDISTLAVMDPASGSRRFDAGQLTQAMAGFAPPDPASKSFTPPKTTFQQPLLAVNSY